MHFKKALLIALCFSVSMIMAADDGLLHQYKFDGDLKDAVGDQHGKVLKGGGATAVYAEGYDGTANGAIEFFTSAEASKWYCIDVGTWAPSQLGTKDEMTVTFWAKWKGLSGPASKPLPQDIINKRDDYKASKMVWGINQHGFTGHMLSVHRDPSVKATSTKGIPLDKWTHVAIAMDGKNAIFFMDGVKYDTQAYTYGSGMNAMIRIGNSANGGKANANDNFNGSLDDVRFYSRMLTEQEVAAVYRPTSGIITVDKMHGSIAGKNHVGAQLFPIPSGSAFRVKGIAGSATVSVLDLRGRQLIKKAVTVNEIVRVDKVSQGVTLVKIATTGRLAELEVVK